MNRDVGKCLSLTGQRKREMDLQGGKEKIGRRPRILEC